MLYHATTSQQDPSQTTPTTPRTTALNLPPPEPAPLSRPSLPRSASANGPFTSLLLLAPSPPTAQYRHRLTSQLAHNHLSHPHHHHQHHHHHHHHHHHQKLTRPPFLTSHHRTKSVEPRLAIINPRPGTVSRPESGFAEAFLLRALEEDQDARSWENLDVLELDHSQNSSSDTTDDLATSSNTNTTDPHRQPAAHFKLDPVLADLEAKSRLNVQTECAICQKKGINYPKCPKCQLEFCSRACRVSMGDGERHQCA
ncbi:hypothetical protein PCANC_21703 [Puccinia coronata f. sp. avenae]|uniref:HIT-type domain-containing protein n=1 Tax=Puccinia coronata f. sp. avenae TaxID=200324 RepID=A0A2N5U9H1_9BASI|nr:hypothetical protein PCANC_21703 [Puccinia coronata f. sp. avenae]